MAIYPRVQDQSGRVDGNSTYVPHVGPSNGTDDTATIQAALDSAAYVRGMPGQNYKYTGFVYRQGGNQTLDMTGCTLTKIARSGGNINSVTNYASDHPAATGADGASTSSSAVIQTTLGAVAVAGQSLTVAGAGPSGMMLCGRVVSATSTSITLDTAAQTTVASAAAVNLYTRDTNITLKGGTWVDSTFTGTGKAIHHILFCRVDGLVIDIDGLSSTPLSGKYAIFPADVTNFDIRVRNLNAGSDGVHIQGPARNGVIRNIEGTSGDDFVVLGTSDASPGIDFVVGDITDVEILDLRPYSIGTSCYFKIYGYAGTSVKRIRVSGVKGTSGIGTAYLGFNSPQNGVAMDDIRIQDVETDFTNIVRILGNGGSLTVRNVSTRYAGATLVAAIDQTAGTTWTTVDVEGVDAPNLASTGAGGSIVQVNGTITNLFAGKSAVSFAGSSAFVFLNNSASSVTKCMISRVAMSGSASLVKAPNSGSVLTELWTSDCRADSPGFFVDFNTATTWNVSNCSSYSPGNGSVNLRAAANVKIIGNGTKFLGGNVNATAGYALRVDCPDFNVDTVKITAPSNGDRCWNGNTASAPYVNGPCVYDSASTVWRPARGYMNASTASLSAGTVTVADTKITANSRIRVFVASPAGTVGFPYVSARSVGTSFTITSTSGSDTSSVYYEVVTY